MIKEIPVPDHTYYYSSHFWNTVLLDVTNKSQKTQCNIEYLNVNDNTLNAVLLITEELPSKYLGQITYKNPIDLKIENRFIFSNCILLETWYAGEESKKMFAKFQCKVKNL